MPTKRRRETSSSDEASGNKRAAAQFEAQSPSTEEEFLEAILAALKEVNASGKKAATRKLENYIQAGEASFIIDPPANPIPGKIYIPIRLITVTQNITEKQQQFLGFTFANEVHLLNLEIWKIAPSFVFDKANLCKLTHKIEQHGKIYTEKMLPWKVRMSNQVRKKTERNKSKAPKQERHFFKEPETEASESEEDKRDLITRAQAAVEAATTKANAAEAPYKLTYNTLVNYGLLNLSYTTNDAIAFADSILITGYFPAHLVDREQVKQALVKAYMSSNRNSASEDANRFAQDMLGELLPNNSTISEILNGVRQLNEYLVNATPQQAEEAHKYLEIMYNFLQNTLMQACMDRGYPVSASSLRTQYELSRIFSPQTFYSPDNKVESGDVAATQAFQKPDEIKPDNPAAALTSTRAEIERLPPLSSSSTSQAQLLSQRGLLPPPVHAATPTALAPSHQTESNIQARNAGGGKQV
ncbi:MAG: hypothetical protein K0Q74_709 [Gammaproteobacteria bacterium]|nr:hypothetical protein [Gammaproteobacteria bacterium]